MPQKRPYELNPKLASEILSTWEIVIDIIGEVEASKMTIAELMAFVPISTNAANPYRVQLDSFVSSKEIGFSDFTEFTEIQFNSSEIGALTFETRIAGSTVYTTRADLAALNIFSKATNFFYLRISATFPSWDGQSDVNIKSNIYIP